MTIGHQDNKTDTAVSLYPKHRKSQRLRVGDPDFESPDGGWAWLILVACGISNLCSFPVFQQYGLVFKEKFALLGITPTQTVTIINTCIAFNTGAGLLNGPVFKRYTTRKVAIFSAFLLTGCLLACIFCASFWTYMIFFSIGYGGAFGLLESANALAMNTYFDKKRRVATGLSWTITAFGPVVCPYIVIALMGLYDMEGTILIFSGLSMHSLVCSLLLQPVHWHTKFKDQVTSASKQNKQSKSGSGAMSRISSAIFSSQYLENDAGAFSSESPMMLVGSKLSLASDHENRSRKKSCSMSKSPSQHNMEYAQDKDGKSRKSSIIQIPIKEGEEKKDAIVINNGDTIQEGEELKPVEEQEAEAMLKPKPADEDVGFWKGLYQDFDFNLLKDPIYVNLMLGLTMTNFVELNFGLLTPMVMAEFHFEKSEIATFMSLLAAADILCRFLVSLIADKVKISNRYFYLLGIFVMCTGRIVFMHTSYSLTAAVIIGSGKALRTIFLILVIPSHVPLERLAAAYGLQYAFSLLFFVIGGPIAGWIRETVGSYLIQMHILNILTYVTAVSWLAEGRITSFLKKRKDKRKGVVDK